MHEDLNTHKEVEPTRQAEREHHFRAYGSSRGARVYNCTRVTDHEMSAHVFQKREYFDKQ